MIKLFFLVLITALSCWSEQASFLNSPEYIGSVDSEHSISNRAFQGIPSLAVSTGGRLWAVWYAGSTPGEDKNNYVVLSSSGDNGLTWHEILVVDPDGEGPVRAFDPEVWMAPDGKLRVTWAQDIRGLPDNQKAHDGSVAGVWMLEIADPETDAVAWKKPVRVTNGIMMCKPVFLSTGEWVLPVSTWARTDKSAKMIVSTDRGRSWAVRGACNVPARDRSFDEHMFIERRDGTIWMLARTKYGIGESVTEDRGITWPELTPSDIVHPSARFFITRLISGNLLLVKHGPLDERTGRSHLTAYISGDEGKTWVGGLLLDEREGVSYPDGQQSADGLIRIIYDYNRTEERRIYLATFCEEDVIAKRAVTDGAELRQLVSDARGGMGKTAD